MSSTQTVENKIAAHSRLWNFNFLLLWQGQFVSAIGDTVYGIALGFWILDMTGSTALMGTLLAVSSLPRIIVTPFAGVIVDRTDRRWLLILMDIIRGIAVALLGIAAYAGIIRIWMVFAAGIIISLCGAFFNPAVMSSLPDIVDKNRIIQANSAFSAIYTGSGIVGSSAGGFLFKILGAPFMFLFNGLSYLLSSLTLFFVRIPKISHIHEKTRFFSDMKQGFVFIWKFRGLRIMMFMASGLNFFANIGILLFLPLFQQQKDLGPSLYGVFIAFWTGGMLIGYLLASAIKFKPEKRYAIFMFCAITNALSVIFVPIFLIFPLMAGLVLFSGATNSVLNSFIMAVMQLTTPQDKRGKVFSLLSSIAMGLTPIAYALGGVLAEIFTVRAVIIASFAAILALFSSLSLSRSFKKYIGYNPDRQTLEELM